MATTTRTEPGEKTARGLLEVVDRIRDPVLGDIEVTALELSLLDTLDFQRLRRIRQLGPTKWVYPGANHDRFSHSLGTLHWAQKIIETCNTNAATYGGATVHEYPRLLARLCALLHDLAHIPYGHTLEDEGSLYPSQWKDSARVQRLLGSSSVIGSKLQAAFASEGKAVGKTVLEDIRNVLLAREESKDVEEKIDPGEVFIAKLPHPYVADIVGNTICADLLDYVARDFLHAGILERYGDRFLRYFVVKEDPSNGVARLTLAVVGRDGRVRQSIVSEAIDLLRRRLSLAEKVYFHRTKVAASAMIISAVANSQFYRLDYLSPLREPMSNLQGSTDLLSMGDDELVAVLGSEKATMVLESGLSEKEILDKARQAAPVGNRRCRFILDHWADRRLYNPVYRTSYWPNRLVSLEHVEKLIRQYSKPQERLQTEITIENAFGLPEGSIIVYCPSRRMGMKVYRARMLLKEGKVVTLEGELEEGKGYPDPGVQEEIKQIKSRHLALWGLHVYVAPEEYDRVDRANISDYCSELFELPNDLDQATALPGARTLKILVRAYAERFSKGHGDLPITVPELRSLEAGLSATYTRGQKEAGLSYESFVEEVQNLRAKGVK